MTEDLEESEKTIERKHYDSYVATYKTIEDVKKYREFLKWEKRRLKNELLHMKVIRKQFELDAIVEAAEMNSMDIHELNNMGAKDD